MATPENPAGVVVCDAGPLIHLDELGCVDLLADFGEVLVPDTVWREVMQHRPSALAGDFQAWQRIEKSRERMSAALRNLTETINLHRGEQEALALAVKRSGALLITDDTAARLAGNRCARNHRHRGPLDPPRTTHESSGLGNAACDSAKVDTSSQALAAGRGHVAG